MLSRRMILVGALGVMLGALPARDLGGQTLPSWVGRPSLEASYTRLRFDGNSSTPAVNGVGGRLMWSLAPSGADATRLAARTDLGLYGTYAPEQHFAQGFRIASYGGGAVADVRPLSAPIAGRVDPYLSIGAGSLHVKVNEPTATTPAPSPLLDRSRTVFAFTPGAGARVRVTPGLALQGDLRDVMTFRDDTRHNIAYGLGLRFAF